MTAYRALLDAGQDVARLALAGANLAVVTLAAISRAGLPQPASAVLMSPWADLASRCSAPLPLHRLDHCEAVAPDPAQGRGNPPAPSRRQARA